MVWHLPNGPHVDSPAIVIEQRLHRRY
jgi:hypothetical protein